MQQESTAGSAGIAAAPGMPPVLELTDISKSFPGVQALKAVRFDMRAGEVHALLGENGAGKSTLIKIVSGVHRPDQGGIRIDGQEVAFASPLEAQRAGIATIYQELLLFPELTVAENIFMGHAPRNRFGIDWAKMRAQALIMVGPVFREDLRQTWDRKSKLYDAEFSHAFRRGTTRHPTEIEEGGG